VVLTWKRPRQQVRSFAHGRCSASDWGGGWAQDEDLRLSELELKTESGLD
jgi:hypothetical protein